MKRLLLVFVLFASSIAISQESWLRIYQSAPWQIKSLLKIHRPDNTNTICVRHNSNSTQSEPGNGIIKRYDRSTNTWRNTANGFLNTHCQTCIDPPYIWTQCYEIPFFMISNQDSNFILKYMITPCASCPDANTLITYDAGITQLSYYNIFGIGGTMIYPNGGDIDPENDSICYYGFYDHYTGTESTIFKSTNRGANWFATTNIPDLRSTAPPNSWQLSGGFIKVNPFNTNYLFTSHRDYMMLSTDGGWSFNPLSIPPLKDLSFDYSDEIVYGFVQNKIYKSVNYGLSWDSSEVTFTVNALEISPDNNTIMYAGSVNGLYRSSNAGQNWYLYNNTFQTSKEVTGLVKDLSSGDTIFVSTTDAVYKVFADQLMTLNHSESTTPIAYTLSQNFPNPFNPLTRINYELRITNYVSLKVYDALGKEVATLVNEKLSAGSYEVEFDGSNFPSGVYFYKLVVSGANSLSAGNFSETKRMILLK